MKPLILVNFKTYPEATGKKSLPLARKISQVRKQKYQLAVAPSILNLKEVSEKTKLWTFSQHTDSVDLGAHTGRIPAKELKQIGVTGTILNHSERKIPFNFLKKIMENCKKERLKTVICASTISEVKKVAKLKPNYIAYEPEELIGGNISVTESQPVIIVRAVKAARSISPKTKVLIGAGIHSKEDLEHAFLLGAKGVLIGHAVAQAKDPTKFLREMLP